MGIVTPPLRVYATPKNPGPDNILPNLYDWHSKSQPIPVPAPQLLSESTPLLLLQVGLRPCLRHARTGEFLRLRKSSHLGSCQTIRRLMVGLLQLTVENEE